MDRSQKEQIVANLHQIFANTTLVVVTHQVGLSVADATELRRRMGEAGATFRVTKNRLTKIALEDTSFAGLAELFVGPTAIAFSEDPVAAARVVVEYAKKNTGLQILGGALGETMLDVDGVKGLASLPSLDALRGKIIGLLNAPATKVAGVLQAPAGQMARVLGAYARTGEAA